MRHGVAASTQNQAFNALLFLYNEVLKKRVGLIDGVVRAKRPHRLPVVLTQDEVKRVIDQMSGVPRLTVREVFPGFTAVSMIHHEQTKNEDISSEHGRQLDRRAREARHTRRAAQEAHCPSPSAGG